MTIREETPVKKVLHSNKWLELTARLGYVTRGVTFILVGIFALQAAFGLGRAGVDKQEALKKLGQQPFGTFILFAIVIGLVAYVIWRFVAAIWDPEDKGTDLRGLVKRGAYLVSGVVYASLAYTAFQIILGQRVQSNDFQEEMWTARIMQLPYGRWLVGIGGLIAFGIAIFQFYLAYSENFRNRLDERELDETEKLWVIWIARVGFIAYGIIDMILGIFLVRAAWNYNPQEAGSLGEALQELLLAPAGPWALGTVAIGLIAYGLFSAILGRYRIIEVF